MSFENITNKLLNSIKTEIKKEKNTDIINNEIVKPIVDKVLEQLYPYFIGTSLIIAFIVISVFVILCLNGPIGSVKKKTSFQSDLIFQ